MSNDPDVIRFSRISKAVQLTEDEIFCRVGTMVHFGDDAIDGDEVRLISITVLDRLLDIVDERGET